MDRREATQAQPDIEKLRDAQRKEPILALTLHCMDSQLKILEKIDEVREYIKGLTPKQFEGLHREVPGVVIRIVDLTPDAD